MEPLSFYFLSCCLPLRFVGENECLASVTWTSTMDRFLRSINDSLKVILNVYIINDLEMIFCHVDIFMQQVRMELEKGN